MLWNCPIGQPERGEIRGWKVGKILGSVKEFGRLLGGEVSTPSDCAPQETLIEFLVLVKEKKN